MQHYRTCGIAEIAAAKIAAGLTKNVAAYIDDVNHIHKLLTHLYRQGPIMSSRYGSGPRMTLVLDAFSNFAGVLKNYFYCCNAAGLLFAP